MSYCPHCGTALQPTDRFCPGCGRAAQTATTPETSSSITVPTTAPAASAGRKLGPLFFAGCFTLIAAIGGFIALILLLTRGVTDAAKDHLNMLARGEVDAAYQAASPVFRDLVKLEDYRALVERRPAIRQTRSISVPERGVEDGIANLTAQVTDSSGVSRDVPMRLRKEADRWRVIAIDLNAFPATPPSTPGSRPSPPPTPAGEVLKKPDNRPRVGDIVIGSGRDENGVLLHPGATVPATASMLSAEIPLIDHPLGSPVMIWIEHITSGRKMLTVSATIEGTGSVHLPLDLPLGDEKLTPGKHRLVVQLDEDSRFTKEFEVQ